MILITYILIGELIAIGAAMEQKQPTYTDAIIVTLLWPLVILMEIM